MERVLPRRVVVSVWPRIFGDALSIALRDRDLEVEVRSPSPNGDGEDEGRFDVALTTGEVPSGVCADAVVILPDSPDGGAVTVIRPSGVRERVEVVGLPGVVDLVASLLAGSG